MRDPERWYDSVAETIYPISTRIPAWLGWLSSWVRRSREMSDAIVWQRQFGGRFEDRQHALRVFNEHVEAVRAAVAPERPLVFEVKEGWGPLCRFLGVPVPDVPFPHLNEAASLRRIRRAIEAVRWAPAVVALVLAGVVATLLL